MTIINKICLAAASIICLLTLMGAGCAGNAGGVKSPEKPVIEVESDKAIMWNDLVKQVEFGPRVPGTQAHKNTRDWIVASLVPYCDSVKTQQFSHILGGKNITMWNVIANINGKATEPRDKVLLAAHWDTRPTADNDPNPLKTQTPIDGANDGASGVAILLEIARMIKNHPIDRDVELVFFDGEDYGPKIENMLLGSAYYAKNIVLKPDWGILLDMVGDADLAVYREPNSEKLAKFVNDKIFRNALNAGYIKNGTKPGFIDQQFKYPIIDDHIAINDVGIPMVDLIDFDYGPNNKYWHTTGDTINKCSAESLKVMADVVYLTISKQ